MRLVLFRQGAAGPISYVPEEKVTELPAESLRGGLRAPRWLVADYYAFPKSGPGSDRCRLCSQEQADAICDLNAQIKDLQRQRREVVEEAWRRADKYTGRN